MIDFGFVDCQRIGWFSRRSEKLILLVLLFGMLVYGKEKIHYRADQIVIKQKQKIIVLTGRAFIRKGKQGLSADKIIWNQAQETAEAFNKVKFLNQEQGVVYRGGYLKFYLDQDKVFAKEKPSIQNKKKKTIIHADNFTAFTQSNIIDADGGTLIYMNQKQTNEMIAKAKRARYYVANNDLHLFDQGQIITTNQLIFADDIVLDQSNQILFLKEKVRILSTNSSKAKEEISSYDRDRYVLSCESAKLVIRTGDLECRTNARIKHREEDKFIAADKFIYNHQEKKITLTDRVHFYENRVTNEYHSFSQWARIDDRSKIVIQSNQFFAYEQTGVTGETNHTLNCDSFSYYYQQKQLAPEKDDLMECRGNGVLHQVEEQSQIRSDYLYYRPEEKYGRAEEEPYWVNLGETNQLYVYSRRMELREEQKQVLFDEQVSIVDRLEETGSTNSLITCDRATYDYRQPDGSQSLFYCHTNVNVFFPERDATLNGDLLTYYLKDQVSRMDGNISFKQYRHKTNFFQGTALYAINDHASYFFNLYEKVEVDEFINQKKVNQLFADRVKYSYRDQNTFEAFTNVDYYHLEDQTHLYADYLYYDQKKQYGYALGRPLLRQKSDDRERLYFAQKIELDDKQKKVNLSDEIYSFNIPSAQKAPSRNVANFLKLNYLNCQEATYDYLEEKNYFECFKKFHLANHREKTDVYSDYVLYDLDQDYAYLKEKPLIERSWSNHEYRIYATQLEYDPKGEQVHFKEDVLMVQMDLDLMTNTTMSCDYSLYNFSTNNHQLECFTNVIFKDFQKEMNLKSRYTRYQPDDKYFFTSGKPLLTRKENNRTTTIQSDVMERFEDQKLMYAKGNVLIDNEIDRAKSDWAVYNTQTEKIDLYGNPQVLDAQGSAFGSEQITFDVIDHTMQLDSGVSGNLIFEK